MVGVVVLVVAGLIALIIWEPFARKLGQDVFPDIIRTLLIRTENGGFCRFDHRDSDIWFSIERLRGSGSNAVLALRIPRRDWTLGAADELRRVFESNGYRFVVESDNPSLLAKVLIPVDDIWPMSSGASGAHAARLFLQVVGLGQGARFNVEEGGRRYSWTPDSKPNEST